MSRIFNFPIPPKDNDGALEDKQEEKALGARDLLKAFTGEEPPKSWPERLVRAHLTFHLEERIAQDIAALRSNAPDDWLNCTVVLIMHVLGKAERFDALLAASSVLERAKQARLDDMAGGLPEGSS